MSYIKLVYHIIFGTYKRRSTIPFSYEREMYKAIFHVLMRHNAFVHRIGGMPDHIHICMELPATKSISTVVQTLKRETSIMFKSNPNFPLWEGWEDGYGAFTCDATSIEDIVEYIRLQKSHHLTETYMAEYNRWLLKCGCPQEKLMTVQATDEQD